MSAAGTNERDYFAGQQFDRLGVRGVERLYHEVLHPGVDQRLVVGGDLRWRANHATKLLLLVDARGVVMVELGAGSRIRLAPASASS